MTVNGASRLALGSLTQASFLLHRATVFAFQLLYKLRGMAYLKSKFFFISLFSLFLGHSVETYSRPRGGLFSKIKFLKRESSPVRVFRREAPALQRMSEYRHLNRSIQEGDSALINAAASRATVHYTYKPNLYPEMSPDQFLNFHARKEAQMKRLIRRMGRRLNSVGLTPQERKVLAGLGESRIQWDLSSVGSYYDINRKFIRIGGDSYERVWDTFVHEAGHRLDDVEGRLSPTLTHRDPSYMIAEVRANYRVTQDLVQAIQRTRESYSGSILDRMPTAMSPLEVYRRLSRSR